MSKFTIKLANDQLRRKAHEAIDRAPASYIVEFSEPTRSSEQSARFHAAVRDVSKQVEWGGQKWNEEQWKAIFVASLYKQAVVQSVIGEGLIIINPKTSRMTIGEMSDLTDLVYAFGNEHDVEWTEPR